MAKQAGVIWFTGRETDSSKSCQYRGNGGSVDIKVVDVITQEDAEEEEDSLKTPKRKKIGKIEFNIDETPPLHIAFVYAFQIIFTNLPGSVLAVFVLHGVMCGGQDYVFMAQLMSSVIFVSGLATLLQVMFGSRLPVTQGSSFIFFPPIIAMMSSPQWKCPEQIQQSVNGSDIFINGTLLDDGQEIWRERVLEVSGGLIAAALVEVFLGVSGLVGLLMNFIGPLTLAPTLMLIGFSLFPVATNAAKHQWGVAFLMAGMIIVLAVGLGDVQVPMITWNRKRGFHIARYPLLRMFSNLLTIGLCWLVCYILTITGSLTDNPDEVGYMARTDAKMDAITKIKWFYIPYPGHFGVPTFSPGIFLGILAATMSSVMESIGDYHATARVCGVPAPPKHAINRGIAMEGVASVLSGLIGTCHATTSYSNVIGFIAYSGVASRVPWILMGITLMICSIFGKLAGALASIPEPILGGIAMVGLGLVIIVGMSQLHSVDLMLTRNQMALGLALMLGMMMPAYMKSDTDIIKTGYKDVDQVLRIFLSTGPFIGGIVGLIMDNILPGTRKQRGMIPEAGEEDNPNDDHVGGVEVYDLPFCTAPLRRFRIFSLCPALPCFKGFPCSCKPPCRKRTRKDEVNSLDPSSSPLSENVTSL